MTPYGFKILVEKNVHNFWKTLLLNSHFDSFPFKWERKRWTRILFLSVSPEWWRIVGDDDQFGFALSQRFQRLIVSQTIFAGFHNQSQTGIGAF